MTMTVGKLAELLATQPQDRIVVLASDAEGNEHSPLADGDEALYAADSAHSGEVYLTHEELDAELAEPPSGFTEDDRAPDNAVPALVLAPTN